ncbi:IclR family transcriptional regulator [Pseudonocardia nigra]|uniref:IclR family transcriptional regulator n=1 Tax=Pseudonocardia nigra TaxID=1921578 RepID=UPI001C5F35AA|nr:IclR family transcriptional regulator [Pseudonocardia nigra]
MGSSTSPAVGRALDVLSYLASRPRPVRVATLCRDLGLPRSSVYHLLTVLEERGFVTHLPDEPAYGLGPAAFAIGSADQRRDPLERLARPLLTRVAAELGVCAHLGILHGAETVYLLKEQPRMPLSLITAVGVRLPAHLTANGRALLAHLPPSQLRALFPDRSAFTTRTGAGPASLRELRDLLGAEKAQGWAEERGHVTAGFRSVAACAFDHGGRPLTAISVTWRDGGEPQPVARIVRVVRTAAERLTGRLAGRAPGAVSR